MRTGQGLPLVSRDERAEAVRAAVLNAREKLSYRELSARIGVSVGALRNLEAGATPQDAVLERFERWLRQFQLPDDTPEAEDESRLNVDFLKPAARRRYDELVGSYVTRGWRPSTRVRAREHLVAALRGANTMKMGGSGSPELSEKQQLRVIEEMAAIVEAAFAEKERTRT